MNKVEIRAWIAGLPEDDPSLEVVDAIRRGEKHEIAAERQALTMTIAAKRAGVSRPLLYRALAAGALRVFLPYHGARARITEGELARWLASRKQPGVHSRA